MNNKTLFKCSYTVTYYAYGEDPTVAGETLDHVMANEAPDLGHLVVTPVERADEPLAYGWDKRSLAYTEDDQEIELGEILKTLPGGAK